MCVCVCEYYQADQSSAFRVEMKNAHTHRRSKFSIQGKKSLVRAQDKEEIYVYKSTERMLETAKICQIRAL